MYAREFRDGAKDGLEALEPLDPDKISSFGDLLEAMGKTAFGGRHVGKAFDVLWEMVADPECKVVMTLSGAMTIAKMGKIITKMIDEGMVQCIISTGALMAHGLSESVGKTHYRHDPSMSDEELFKKGYNRVYDTLEMEANLNYVEHVVAQTLKRLDQDQPLSSHLITRELGKTLAEELHGDGILKSAYLKNVPVYIPAFTDSEVGLDIGTLAMARQVEQARSQSDQNGDLGILQTILQYHPSFNPYFDLNSYADHMLSAKRRGIFTIGGGVPRNWAQQVGPYVEVGNLRLGLNVTPPRFHYGVRICPEPDYWGGLSGCTYQEGLSWGKFVTPKDGGRFAEVLSDATVVWPLLLMGLLERKKSRSGAWFMISSMGQRVCLAVIGSMLLWSVPASAGNSGETDLRMRGQANAPVTLIEYSDFTCGFCLKFFKRTWPRIQAQYVDTGKVRFMYRDFPRGDQGSGLDAATAARCAGEQGQYWAMHDRLFSEGGQLDKQVYRRHAATLNLDQAAFERCMSDGRFTKAIFEDRQEANQWGFHGTPGFILVRTATEPTDKEPAVAIPGAFPFEMFAEEIDRLLANGKK